jgi:plasmid replication initiation protein
MTEVYNNIYLKLELNYMDTSKLVVKDNALIDACFNLSLVEQRLLLLAITEAREFKELSSSTAIEVTAKQYSTQFKIHEKEAYNALKTACDLLFERRFSYVDRYKGDKLIKRVRWVSELGYVENKGLVLLNLSDTVVSLISRLENQFTKYHLNQVSGFKSKYSIRLYELVVKWLANAVTQKYAVADLRAKLGLEPSEYKTMSLFKTNVLDKAITEINHKADIEVSYEQFKSGRTITHIQFKIKQKSATDTVKRNKVKEMTAKQIDMFSDKLSKLESFQNYYIADAGVSITEYKKAIATKLQDKFYVDAWGKYLAEVGFTKNILLDT